MIEAQYSRDVNWAASAQYLLSDIASLTLSDPVSDKTTVYCSYAAYHANIPSQVSQLFQEVNLGVRWKIMTNTELYVQYSLRTMSQRYKKTATYLDPVNEPYTVRSVGDFTANSVSFGLSLDF